VDKAGLIRVNNGGNDRFKSVDYHLGKEFHGAILKRDRMKRISGTDPILFGQQDKMSSIKGSPNPPTQLVSIALNMLPCKQKAEVAGELMRRE